MTARQWHASSGPPGTEAAPIPPSAEPLRGARIVLAEDSAANQRLIAFCLERAGAAVTAVENGKRLVETLAGGSGPEARLLDPLPADLVLTDIEMPEMDGYTAVRLLRALGCALPIVALTARTAPADVEQCHAAGCDAYSAKPLDLEQLVSLCARVLAGKSPAPARHAVDSVADALPAREAGNEPLRSELAGDPDLDELIAAFVADLPQKVAAAESLYRSGHLDDLVRLAHQLKGSGGSYGFPSITAAARQVESDASSGDTGALQRSMVRLVQLCRAAVPPGAAARPQEEYA